MDSLYATIHSIVSNQISTIKGHKYFPFMYCLFLFILVNNLIGLVPYSFASTSHFFLAFSLSFTIVLGATILGFQIHKSEFFSLFVPAGCPLVLLRAPCEALLFIEALSNFSCILVYNYVCNTSHGYLRPSELISQLDWVAKYKRCL